MNQYIKEEKSSENKKEKISEELSSSSAYISLAKSYLEMGQINKSIDKFKQAIDRDPHQPLWVYRHLGKLLVKEDRIDEGVNIFQKAIKIYPHKSRGYLSLGSSLAKQGKLAEAITYYQKALTLDPNLPKWIEKDIAEYEAKINEVVEIEGVTISLYHEEISSKIKQVIRQGKYESQEIGILKKILTPEDNILEIGGGIGYLSIYAKKRFPDITISSYEANPALIKVIKYNQEINECSLPVHNVLLDEEEGEMEFFVAKRFWASSTVRQFPGSKKIVVKKTDINKTIAEQGANFIIMDIEGGETDLVPKINYQNINKILMEIHPNAIGNEGVSSIFKYLLDSGFIYDIEKSAPHVVLFYKQN